MSASVSRPDPVSPLVQRLVAASGIVFGVLLVVTIALAIQEPPGTDDPVGEWTQFARDSEKEMRFGALALGLATYAFVLFLGYLRSVLGEAEQRVRGFTRGAHMVLVGGVLGIVGMSLFVYLSALSVQEPDTPAETLRALNYMGGAGLGLSAGGFGACLVTVGLMNAVVRALPAWLGWVALVSGLAFVLQLGVLLTDDLNEGFFQIFFPLAFVPLVVFSIGASVTFLREQAARGALPAPPPPPAA